mgnify:CR=1 FL=1
MLAGVPLAFTLGLDAGSFDHQVLRPLAAAIMDAHVQSRLASAQGAEMRHPPVQTDKAQRALYEPGRLSTRHAIEDLHRQAGLDGLIAESLLPTALARRRLPPNHMGIKPHCQRTASPRCLIVSDQFVDLYFVVAQLLVPPSYHAGFMP